jgi:hypothetical protein
MEKNYYVPIPKISSITALQDIGDSIYVMERNVSFYIRKYLSCLDDNHLVLIVWKVV